MQLFKKTLSSQLRKWRNHYENSYQTLDYKRINCYVLGKPGKWRVVAGCRCSDPAVNGFSMNDVLRLYESKPHVTKVEAQARLECEVRQASRDHPDACFFTEQDRLWIKDHVPQAEPVCFYVMYDAGKWLPAQMPEDM